MENLHKNRTTYYYLKQNIPLPIISLGLILFSFYSFIFPMLLIGVYLFFESNYKAWLHSDFDKQLSNWFNRNDGKILFMYATNKKPQELIEEKLLKVQQNHFFKIWYEGPKIKTNFNILPGLLKWMIQKQEYILVNDPKVYKIVNNNISKVAQINIEQSNISNIEDILKNINLAQQNR